jgi:hypothetical protein
MIFDDLSAALSERTIRDAALRSGLPESKLRRMKEGCGFVMDRRTDFALWKMGLRIRLVKKGKPVYGDDLFTALARVCRGHCRDTARRSGVPCSKWRNIEAVAANRGVGWSLNLSLLLGLQRLGYDLRLERVDDAGNPGMDG